MQKVNYNGTDEVVYYEKLSNGIEVYLYPNDNSRNFYMTFNTKFGSMYTEYKYSDEKKYHTVPNGTAHFLEHQMFQEGNGVTAFKNFATLGSSVNAFTTYGLTCYEVIASDNFKENLEYLLDFVQNPVYETSSVNNEKGIIKEEIGMYDNNPNAALHYGIEYNLNNVDKHKYLISGTYEDIKSITPAILYDSYNAFYQPSNMFIVISGKFKPLEALGIIKENQNNKEFPKERKIDTKFLKEPLSVEKNYEIRYMDVSVPKVSIGYKIDKILFKDFSDLELKIYLDALLQIKFGSTSDFLERLTDNNLITWDIGYTREVRNDYILLLFEIETEYKDEVIDLIREELKSIDITKEELNRIKRVNISNFILHFNDILSVVEDIQDDVISYNRIQDNILNEYKNISLDKIKKIIKFINIDNESIYIIDRKTS